ncbi:MAG TPA: hypothetical protein VJA21_03370 [Verrucomicrobiae bacterium]
MSILVVASLFLLGGPSLVLAAGNTNEFTLLKWQSRRDAYEWRISEARILATPTWETASAKIPVAPDKAWKIVTRWLTKKGKGDPGSFIKMEVRLFDLSETYKPFRDRFFYRIEYPQGAFDYMVAVVLMDGTVLEPKWVPWPKPEEIK